MATISAADVKKLRDLTGAGMMDSKNALTEADGDFDKAVEALRIKAGAKSTSSAAGDATNGLVAAAEGAMIQLACETDFVAKNEDFQTLANNIVAHAAADQAGRRGDAAGARSWPTARPSGRTSSRSPASSARSSC